MTPESLRTNHDLTLHIYNRISEICMQTSALAPDPGVAIGLPISACLLVILDILAASESICSDPSVILHYRQELADRILLKSSGSISVGTDGVRPLE